jgi:hypothetical protein
MLEVGQCTLRPNTRASVTLYDNNPAVLHQCLWSQHLPAFCSNLVLYH